MAITIDKILQYNKHNTMLKYIAWRVAREHHGCWKEAREESGPSFATGWDESLGAGDFVLLERPRMVPGCLLALPPMLSLHVH